MTLRHDRDADLHFGQDSAEVITLSEPISGIPANARLMDILQELFDRVILLENGTPFRVFTANALLKAALTGSFTADARMVLPLRSVRPITADAAIILGGNSFTSDATIRRTFSGSFTGDAVLTV